MSLNPPSLHQKEMLGASDRFMASNSRAGVQRKVKLGGALGGRLSAISGPSHRSSNSQVILPWFLGSGHWIGGTSFSRLIGSNAA
jgi:hypothetical protein